MEQWEFLIQKAGDRDWLPLPSPESEILEGRYRLMARLAHDHCPVEVRVRYLDIQANPPRRKLLRRRDRTNASGLVALLPFTMLQSGVWNIQCAVKSGEGEIRVHSLQIQVLEQMADIDVDFEVPSDAADQAFLAALQFNAAPSQAEAEPAALEALSDQASSANAASVTAGEAIDLASDAPSETGADVEAVPESDRPDGESRAQELTQEILEELIQSVRPSTDIPADDIPADDIPADDIPAGAEGAIAPDSTKPPADALALDAPGDSEEVTNPFELASAHLEALEAVDLEDIDPEALDEINRLFQTAEELAEHIIASMAKKFDELAAVLDESAVLEAADAHEAVVTTPQTDEPVDERVAESAAGPADGSLADGSPEVPLSSVDAASVMGTIHISVEQDAYVLHRDRPFTVMGQLEAIAPAQPPHPLDARLRLSLADPQTGRRLMVQDQMLRITTLPHGFTCAIAQPTLPKTHLLLGELILADSRGSTENADSVWATQSFVVTTDLSDLLDTVTQANPQLELQPPPEFASPPEKSPPPNRVTIPDIRQSPSPQHTFRPAGKDPLPPQLTPSGSATPRKTIDLPSFVKGAATTSSDVAIALADAVRTAKDAVPATPKTPPDAAGLANGESMPDLSDPALADSAPENAVSEDFALEQDDPAPPQSDIAGAAASGTDGPMATDDDGEDAANPFQLELQSEPQLESKAPEPANALEQDWDEVHSSDHPPEEQIEDQNSVSDQPEPANGVLAQEIVVDDGAEESDRPPAPAPSPEPSHLPGLTLPEDMPIPTPEILLPAGELVAGETVTVVVRLPDQPARIYVKLWVYDRQTRSMAEPPRWLVNFYPDGQGCLRATAQLPVPQGCLEVVVEAIAVEVLTQRESRKVSIARPVVPANLPSLSIDDVGK